MEGRTWQMVTAALPSRPLLSLMTEVLSVLLQRKHGLSQVESRSEGRFCPKGETQFCGFPHRRLQYGEDGGGGQEPARA